MLYWYMYISMDNGAMFLCTDVVFNYLLLSI